LPYEVCHCSYNFLDWHGRIYAVLIKKVDMSGLQPPQCLLSYLANTIRPAICTSDLSIFESEAKFCSNDCPIPLTF
jgi:hypothetical protein